MTNKSELLRQCAASGQMDAAQIAAHERDGDFLPIGDRHTGIVGHAGELATRRVQEQDLRWSREIGYEAADPARWRTEEAVANQSRSAGRALLLYAGVVLATALAALAIYLKP